MSPLEKILSMMRDGEILSALEILESLDDPQMWASIRQHVYGGYGSLRILRNGSSWMSHCLPWTRAVVDHLLPEILDEVFVSYESDYDLENLGRAQITILSIESPRVHRVPRLEVPRGLEFFFGNRHITDLAPLGNCPNLRKVETPAPLKSLAWVRGCRQLSSLVIEGTELPLDEFRALTGLSHLHSLVLSRKCQVSREEIWNILSPNTKTEIHYV